MAVVLYMSWSVVAIIMTDKLTKSKPEVKPSYETANISRIYVFECVLCVCAVCACLCVCRKFALNEV